MPLSPSGTMLPIVDSGKIYLLYILLSKLNIKELRMKLRGLKAACKGVSISL